MLALLDCHYPGDVSGRRVIMPYCGVEVSIGRQWNADLYKALRTAGVNCQRIDVDTARPQSVKTAMELKAQGVRRVGANVAIETHCNYHPSIDVRGWAVLIGRNDDRSRDLGWAVAKAWEPLVREYKVGKRVRIYQVPHNDTRYRDPVQFEILRREDCSLVLPELGNLEVAKIRHNLIARDRFWFRFVEATAQAVKEVLGDEREDTTAGG